MIPVFKKKNPLNILLLVLYALALKLPVFLNPVVPEPGEKDGFLYRRLVEWLAEVSDGSALLFSVLAFLLVFLQALHLNRIVNTQKLLPRPTFLGAMGFLLVTSFFPEWLYFSPGLLVNTLLIWAVVKMMALYHTQHPKTQLFNMGLLVGFASFLFFPAAAFLLLVFFAMLLMRPFRFSEWVITVMGILAPYYFLFIVLYLTGTRDFSMYVPNVSVSMLHFRPSVPVAVAISFMLIPFIMGGYFVQANLGKMLIQTRKSWSLLLCYILVSTFIPFINAAMGFGNWVLCAVPFAFFHSAAWFYPKSNILTGILHWMAFAFALYLNY